MKYLQILVSMLALILLILFCQGMVKAENVNINIIAQIESNNNPKAISYRGAIGLCQIMPCVLKDFNKYNMQGDGLSMRQMFDLYDNKVVANWYINIQIPKYLKHYHLKDTLENRLRAYNSGIGTLKKGKFPKETRDYIIKYKRLLKEVF